MFKYFAIIVELKCSIYCNQYDFWTGFMLNFYSKILLNLFYLELNFHYFKMFCIPCID